MRFDNPAPIEVDDSLWPLVIVRFTRKPSEQDLRGYLQARLDHLQRPEKQVSILDMRQLDLVPSAQGSKVYLDWVDKHGELLGERMLGTAYIIASPFLRMLLNSVLHLRLRAMPHHVAPSLLTAAQWAAVRFEEAGLSEVAQRILSHPFLSNC